MGFHFLPFYPLTFPELAMLCLLIPIEKWNEMPGLPNKSLELCLLLLIHVKILYTPTKAPWHPLWHKASAETSSSSVHLALPSTRTCASANNSAKLQSWHRPQDPLGSEPTERRTQHHGRHSLHLMGKNYLWGGMGFQEPWEGVVSALTGPTGASAGCTFLYALAKFPSQVWGRGKGTLVTQLMTLSFSAEKLHEETIKDTLSTYLIIFVKQNVIIMSKCR